MVRVIDGELRRRQKIRLMARGRDYEVEDLGVLTPKPRPIDTFGAGEVGFIVANIKTVADVSIGDTVTEANRPTTEPFPGFQEVKPMVFAGLYPVEANQYEDCATHWKSFA
jgi:GTP-binding protein LepA